MSGNRILEIADAVGMVRRSIQEASPFALGGQRHVAVKVVGERGNGLMAVRTAG